MFRTAWLLIALFVASSAHADVKVSARAGAQRDSEVRVLWIPTQWENGVEGFEIRRRALDDEWKVIGRTAILPAFRDRWLTGRIDYDGLEKVLGHGFDEALKAGFAFIDKSPPKGSRNNFYSYAVHPVVNAEPHHEMADIATWQFGDYERLDITLAAYAQVWDNNDRLEVLFRTNPQEIQRAAAGYRIFEQRGDQRREIGGMRVPGEDERNWNLICARIDRPYPDAVIVSIEDRFGFTLTATSRVNAAQRKALRSDYHDLRCDPNSTGVPRPAPIQSIESTGGR